MTARISLNMIHQTLYTSLTLTCVCACTSTGNIPVPLDKTGFVPIPTVTETTKDSAKFYPVPLMPKGTGGFAKDLVNAMGSPVGQCKPEAENTPHIQWTCADYDYGLETFMESWDKLETSSQLTEKYNYNAMSDWMYFEIDGEVDFFWKTYALDGTQALVTYDPSEADTEIIVGLNSDIATNIAASPGSHKFTSEAINLPIQE